MIYVTVETDGYSKTEVVEWRRFLRKVRHMSFATGKPVVVYTTAAWAMIATGLVEGMSRRTAPPWFRWEVAHSTEPDRGMVRVEALWN